MKPLSCRELRDAWDDYRIGNVAEGEGERVEAHLEACAACRGMTETLDRLSDAVSAVEMDPLVRRRIAVAIAENGGTRARPAAPRPRLALAGALAAACAAAVAIAVWPGGLGREAGPAIRQAAPRPAVAAPRSLPAAGERVRARDEAEGPGFVEVFGGTGLALAAGAAAAVERTGPLEARFALRRGRVVAVVGPHGPGFRFVVATPSGAEVEARGTVFAVEAGDGGEERVRVARGEVEVRAAGRAAVALAAGLELGIGEAAAVPADPARLEADRALAFGAVPAAAEGREEDGAADVSQACAAAASALDEGKLAAAGRIVDRLERSRPASGETRELLARLARAYRRARQFEAAAGAYERLIAKYPGSESAKNGLVALGEIDLDVLGSYGEALAHFERYLELAPDGYLAEAAAAGRARALSRAGRAAEAARAAGEYLAAHPDGANVAEMSRLAGHGDERGAGSPSREER